MEHIDRRSGAGSSTNAAQTVETSKPDPKSEDIADKADSQQTDLVGDARDDQLPDTSVITNNSRPPEQLDGDHDHFIRSFGFGLAAFLSVLIFIFFNWPQVDSWSDLRPLLFRDTTPSGGDMGAHVWGPAYLRDYLLPQGRLSGWTPDWYAGFPAYHFYMVVPPLAIIAINVGLPWYIGIPIAGGVIAMTLRKAPSQRFPTLAYIAGAILAVLLVQVPYGISFKLVTVVGLVALPLAVWKLARMTGAAEPIPACMSLASLIFIFDTNFTIYGGNIASTLAGEFSFSICLMFSLLAIGKVTDGMDTLGSRAQAASLLALAALCHVLPIFFLVPAVLLMVLMHTKISRIWVAVTSGAMALIPLAFSEGASTSAKVFVFVLTLFVLGLAFTFSASIRERAKWLLITGPVSVLAASFWLVPFLLRKDFFNDMGWDPITDIAPILLTTPIKVALPVAGIGLVLSYVARERIGMMFGGTAVVFAVAVSSLGDGPVWNARLSPFYYLSVYMLAAVGLAMILRYIGAEISQSIRKPDIGAMAIGVAAIAVVVIVGVLLPLRLLPFGSENDDGKYTWLALPSNEKSFVPGWTEWNYSGYEEKDAYREYRQVVATMQEVGEENGCGRAMWEHNEDLESYGTPMALMLLPHWTDGCIGSMEGLYFESSASTPFHFLNQSIMSEAPSRPQRDLPYQDFDIDKGVAQLQTTGVRYYMAQTDRAIEAARNQPDLVEIAEAPPFAIFEVNNSELVEGLSASPVVVSGLSEDQAESLEDSSRFDSGWLSQAVEFYNDPNAYGALPAEDGPEEWGRARLLESAETTAIEKVAVSEIEVSTNKISFRVDEIGSPVLVKASYFPNWKAKGADGPWRVGPNLMAVVPNSNSVTLSYGRSGVDLFAMLLSLLGIIGLFLLRSLDRNTLKMPAALGSFASPLARKDPIEVSDLKEDPEPEDVSTSSSADSAQVDSGTIDNKDQTSDGSKDE